jgi:hypothetical protein
MKQSNQQPLDVRHLDKNLLISWKKNTSSDEEDYHVPVIHSSPKPDRPYCFDEKKNHVNIVETPINDYFKPSLIACLTCFWMLGGIICLIQSLKIRQLLKKNSYHLNEQARRSSNRLYTNLILTYVVGGMIIGVLVMTILVTFVVGIKGYFSKSL